MNKRQKNFLIFSAIAIVTIVVWHIPGGNFVLYPFTILGTWFHEMGHGMAALILGGSFHELEIMPDGSGLASFSGELYFGGIGKALVAAAGPIGPVIAGSLFIIFSQTRKHANLVLWLLGLFLILSTILWIRSFFAIAIIIAFAIIILLIANKGKENLKAFTVQFLGVQAIVSVLRSIDYLMSPGGFVGDGQYLSDTAVIAQVLILPHWFWGGTIIVLSAFLFWKSFRIAYRS
ncbi:MAG: M50 family metallopeptidase [Chlorobi bacterium]|nr:M50 family metallopeptidase [Chlorobiota bacterium]